MAPPESSKNLKLALIAQDYCKLAGDAKLDEWMHGLLDSLREVVEKQTMSEMVIEFHEKQELATGLNIEHHGMEHEAIERMFVMDEEYSEMKKELFSGESKQKLAHEIVDCIYTLIGTAVMFGIAIEPVFDAIHKSNMTKGKGFDKTNYIKPEIKV